MHERLQAWRNADSDRRWLSMLINAMEDASVRRDVPCDREVLVALCRQLARPASGYLGSSYSRYN